MKCWKCAREIDTKERVGFRDDCAGCGWSLHVCRNCRFYDPAYHNQCRETQAERVVDKERANFCEFFAPRSAANSASAPNPKPRASLDALFEKKR